MIGANVEIMKIRKSVPSYLSNESIMELVLVGVSVCVDRIWSDVKLGNWIVVLTLCGKATLMSNNGESCKV